MERGPRRLIIGTKSRVINMAKKATKHELISVSSEDESNYSDTPILDIHTILEEHKETKTLVFEPQGYKVRVQRPSMVSIQRVYASHGALLGRNRELRDRVAALHGIAQSEWSMDDKADLMLWNEVSLPYQLDILRLTIVEPTLTQEQLIEWMATLEQSQLNKLYEIVAEMTSPPKAEEIETLKNS